MSLIERLNFGKEQKSFRSAQQASYFRDRWHVTL